MSLRLLFPRSLGEMKAEARADLVAQALSRRLGLDVEVDVAPSYEELRRRMLGAEVDVAWAPPALCAQAEPRARAILTAVRDSGAQFRAALLCRSGAGLTLGTLDGRRAAWSDPLSTGGYLLARAHLRSNGLDPDRIFTSQRFWGSYRDAAMAVVEERADVCSVFVQQRTPQATRESLDGLLGGVGHKLVAFAFTGESPSDGMVITERPDPARAEALVELLTSPRSPTVLREACNVLRFERAEPDAYGLLRSERPAAAHG